jgi:2-polyprenyl-6-methoxyphenol hydroxylase-like FAD-dependent oxidoreductase
MALPSSNTTPLFISGKKILIVGAGISGLTFAAALRKLIPTNEQSPTFIPPRIAIYERDTKDLQPTRQGYSLSIRSDGRTGGLQTLQKLGLLDTALSRSITGIQGKEKAGNFCFWDKNWEEILRAKIETPKGLPIPSMRIARNVLRQTLVDAVLENGDEIVWEVKVVDVEKLESGRIRVVLEGGETDDCDLLIAADGSRSKIRAALRPDDGLEFQKVVGFTGNSKFIGEPPAPANKDWGLMLSGTGTGLFVSPIDDHSVVWSISYLAPETRTLKKQPIRKQDAAELLEEALERGKEIPEPFKTYVEATDLETLQIFNFMDKAPFEHYTGSLKGTNVLFLGDSNHAVTPFAGSGACLALSDGWDLAEQLCKHQKLEDALKAYDKLSISRAKSVLRLSHFTIKYAHAKGWWVWILVFGFKILFKLLMFLRRFQ